MTQTATLITLPSERDREEGDGFIHSFAVNLQWKLRTYFTEKMHQDSALAFTISVVNRSES